MYTKLDQPPTNKQISDLLRGVAAALQVEGASRFRYLAYAKAADSVENASRPIYQVWKTGDLQKLPGIGGSIAQHLDDLFLHGKSEYLDEIVDKYPSGMFAILPIPGIGPKNAYKLASKLGLTRYHSAISKLEKAARQSEIASLEGFGEDGQARILQGIEEFKSLGDRTLLHIADQTVQDIVKYLSQISQTDRVDPLGSIRRRENTVGDIDIAVSTEHPQQVIKHFLKYPLSDHTIESGVQSAAITLKTGHRVDMKVQSPETYGSLLQHFTGSKSHNIALRELAIQKGYTVSEKGIAPRKKTEDRKAFAQEEGFYKYLGLQWIPPEIRQNTGEIEVAQAGNLPKLVSHNQLRGDLHTHSNFDVQPSHDLGLNSMEEMAIHAKQLGYQYIGFSEHNPSMAGHDESDIISIIKDKEKLANQVNEKHEKNTMPHIYNGLEIDIRPDGSLALPLSAFEYLDYAIVSIHSSFMQTENQATRRIISALSHPKAKILGHPTGRVINQRSGVSIDWPQVFEYCLRNNKWLEIDGWPERRDLPEEIVRKAIEFGLKLIIGSDAHQVDHLRMISYGVDTARRGWAQPENIVNTLPLKEFDRLLKE